MACDPLLITGYLRRGLCKWYSASLILFWGHPLWHGDREKLASDLTWVVIHTDQVYLEPSLRGRGVSIASCQLLTGWELLRMAPDSFGSCLGLFRTHGMSCYCIDRVTVVQGQSGTHNETPSLLGAAVAALPLQSISWTSCRLRCSGSQLDQGISFPTARRCPCLTSQDMELRLLQVNLNVFSNILTLQEFIHDHPTIQC